MQFFSYFSLAAASATVIAAQAERESHVGLEYDETADWYRMHEMPVPEVAPEISIVELVKSYVVKLDCPGCPFLVKGGGNYEGLERDNALLLKFDVKDAGSTLPTISLNGGQVLPLAPMPLFINAYQVPANVSKDVIGSIVREGMLEPNFTRPIQYGQFPIRYEHALLKTKNPGQWWLQFDVTGVQLAKVSETVFPEDRKIVQMLITEQKHQHEEGHSLYIQDMQVVAGHLREQPLKMKCGKPAMVKTIFDPKEWDEYGKLGSWSRVWNKTGGRVVQYWLDHIQHNALLLPVVLLLAFIVFFVRVWCQRRQQDKNCFDAEYALLEVEEDQLPPAYSDIPVIKIEEYD